MKRKPPVRVTVPMIARMRALAGVGLSAEAISRVIALDYGEAPCESTIRVYLGRRIDRPYGGMALGTATLTKDRVFPNRERVAS